MLFADACGQAPVAPLDRIIKWPAFSSLRRANVHLDAVVPWLRNAWAAEALLAMPLSIAGAGQLARYACAWAPVQAYYSVYSALNALAAAEDRRFDDHRATLNFIDSIVQDRPWIPDVYCYGCLGSELLKTLSFPKVPPSPRYRISNLREPQDIDEARALAMTCLKTTRTAFANQRAREARRRLNRKNVPRDERSRIDSNMPTTTLFDFLYRVRIRCNYGESESFIKGASQPAVAINFLTNIVAVTGFALALIETAVAGRTGITETRQMVESFVSESNLKNVPVGARWGVK
jgi:hypothetical protein